MIICLILSNFKFELCLETTEQRTCTECIFEPLEGRTKDVNEINILDTNNEIVEIVWYLNFCQFYKSIFFLARIKVISIIWE
jgi:hypothetical protein